MQAARLSLPPPVLCLLHASCIGSHSFPGPLPLIFFEATRPHTKSKHPPQTNIASPQADQGWPIWYLVRKYLYPFFFCGVQVARPHFSSTLIPGPCRDTHQDFGRRAAQTGVFREPRSKTSSSFENYWPNFVEIFLPFQQSGLETERNCIQLCRLKPRCWLKSFKESESGSGFSTCLNN